MSRRFITANRAQSFLLPPSRDDWVEEGHLVRFLHDCIEQFDLSEFTSSYSREGGSPYDPKMSLLQRTLASLFCRQLVVIFQPTF